ncbi:hypothetical protein PIB30_103772, partial [Stylosanthes scabra]|nr:hypothetical protein [Stylosanthes scabra]
MLPPRQSLPKFTEPHPFPHSVTFGAWLLTKPKRDPRSYNRDLPSRPQSIKRDLTSSSNVTSCFLPSTKREQALHPPNVTCFLKATSFPNVTTTTFQCNCELDMMTFPRWLHYTS